MHLNYLFCFLALVICSCNTPTNNNNSTPTTSIIQPKATILPQAILSSELKQAYWDTLPFDTLVVPLNGQQLCLSHDLDSLSQLGLIDDMVHIVDIGNNIVLLAWHIFMGRLGVKKIANQSYTFTGKAFLPVDGDWEKPFKEYQIISYTLSIKEGHYVLYRNQDIVPKISFSLIEFQESKNFVANRHECISDDFDIARKCQQKIMQYEFQLFASLISGNTTFKKTYLNLRKDLPLINAGELSEYLLGNMMLLNLLGIIDKKDYQSSNYFLNGGYVKMQYCY